MEMVGGRKNIDFHNRESTSSIAKKLSLVGLWCIQFSASRRPPMSKAVQMLEGAIEINTPPFPFPVDPPLPPCASEQPSSPADLEVQMINLTSTQRANTSR